MNVKNKLEIEPLPVLSLDNVSFAYNREPAIIKNMSFDVKAQEIVAILGPSGCGKTTLLRMIAGLLEPREGNIQFNGDELESNYSKTGFVFQKPVLLPWKNLESNMELPATLLGCSVPHVRIKELLVLVGLWGDRYKYPDELSGGMQARAAIARALVYHPKVLLLDEPFGALDQATRDYLNIEISRIFRTTVTSAIIVTHSISEAVFLADMVLLMGEDGRIRHRIETHHLSPSKGEELFSFPDFVNKVSQIRLIMGRGND